MFIKFVVFVFIVVNTRGQTESESSPATSSETSRFRNPPEEPTAISPSVAPFTQSVQAKASELDAPSDSTPQTQSTTKNPIFSPEANSGEGRIELLTAALKSFSEQTSEPSGTKDDFIRFVMSAVQAKTPQKLSTDKQRVRLLIRKLFKTSPRVVAEHAEEITENPRVSKWKTKNNFSEENHVFHHNVKHGGFGNNSNQIEQKLQSIGMDTYLAKNYKYETNNEDSEEGGKQNIRKMFDKPQHSPLPNKKLAKYRNKFHNFDEMEFEDLPQQQPRHPAEDSESTQAQNAKYSFSSDIQDDINGNLHQRQETRDGTKVTGHYTYEDGFFRRTVHYVADENGYRVVKEDVDKIGDGPSYNPNGMAMVHSYVAGKNVDYRITTRDFDGTLRDNYGDPRYTFNDRSNSWY